MGGLCTNCSKRDNCVELCEKAERYVGQDHVSQRESTKPEWLLDLLRVHVTLHKHEDIASYFQEDSLSFDFLTPLQNKILYLFYFEGLTYKEIAFHLSNQYRQLSSSDVNYQIRSAKQRISQFLSDNRGV